MKFNILAFSLLLTTVCSAIFAATSHFSKNEQSESQPEHTSPARLSLLNVPYGRPGDPDVVSFQKAMAGDYAFSVSQLSHMHAQIILKSIEQGMLFEVNPFDNSGDWIIRIFDHYPIEGHAFYLSLSGAAGRLASWRYSHVLELQERPFMNFHWSGFSADDLLGSGDLILELHYCNGSAAMVRNKIPDRAKLVAIIPLPDFPDLLNEPKSN